MLDSFQVAAYMCKLQPNSNTEYFVLFVIFSLFTNEMLDETIDADFLYRGPIKPPSFPEVVFVELMEMANKFVSFSFNNGMSNR